MTVEEALKVSPHDVEICHLRNEVIAARVSQLIAASEEEGIEDPESLLKEAIGIDRFNLPVRKKLIETVSQKALAFDTKADEFLAQGEMERGVSELERAQSVDPTPERAAKLERARTAQEFALGMKYYGEKDYTQAVFQFRKVLGRDSAHAEAKRYLQYAQKFQQDTNADNSLNNRFSMLE